MCVYKYIVYQNMNVTKNMMIHLEWTAVNNLDQLVHNNLVKAFLAMR